ncbi:hypothetical protein [Haemophilus parainfluenzae]|uniref:hypothetical protein n=1 Tax=Haemophilus parainfluenzae TaxID=729 RepID=UPI00352D7969
MKFRSLYKFSEIEFNNNLIFFAQLLDEMLFDYTLDTYKPSILNVHSLIEEAFEVIKEVNNGNIKQPNIEHVISELVKELEKDMIANKMLLTLRTEILAVLKNKKENENLGKIKNILEILKSLLDRSSYKEKLELEIIENLKKETTEFEIIRRLSRSYITFLISNGYNTKYIRKEVLHFFWEGYNKFNKIDDIKNLFDLFSFDYKRYNVFFSADNILSTYDLPNSNETKLINVYNRNELPEIIQDKNFLKLNPTSNFYSMKCKEIDPFSARERIERNLRLFANLINIFHHKKNIKWQKKFIVIDENNNTSFTINESIKAMHKCIDLKEPKAKIQLQDFLTSFYLEDDSFNKFINSVRLHSMAIHTESHENQLLNLWVSLESLVPADTKSDKNSNIVHIVNSIIPFLNMFYFQSLVIKLIKDLVRWNVNILRKSLRGVEGKDSIIKIVNILSKSKYEDKFNYLKLKTEDFQLLNDRLKHFKKIFSSKSKMSEIIKNHTQRLEWQIRRIYRTRNLIVHTGITPKYTAILIEHTHSYLDVLLSTLIKLSSLNRINSVGQGFQYMDLLYNDYIKILDNKNSSPLEDIELEKIFKYLN